MDTSGNDDTNVETHKAISDNPVNYPAPNMSSQWQISGSNLTNESMVMVSMPYLTMEAFNSSSVPVIDSFCPQIYGGFCDVNVPNNDATTSSSFGPVRTDMFWTPNTMLRGNHHAFLPSVPVAVPPSLPHLPTDSGFIERAARFSCFNGGNFGDMLNSFSNISGPLNPYSHSLGPIQGGSKESLGVNGFNALPGIQSQMNEVNRTDGYKEATPACKNDTEESPLKNEKHDEAKDVARTLPNEHDEAGFNGQEEMKGESSSKGPSGKKRKRTGQDMEREEHNEEPVRSIETADNNTTGSKQQHDRTPSSLLKNGGKNCKPGSQGSEPPKEGYIHIRARRGQATNSHSLAERVRREKISERMKFLQDLVPGCSKVTGKAVMLDEIINYVQSLQRQVEFLSMKLATVNPRLDFNIETLLAKDILQPRPGLSPSSLAFHPDMHLPYNPLHHSQTGLVQAGVSSLCNNSPETLHRPSSVQPSPSSGGFKEAISKVPNVWEDELHNVVHMGFDSSDPLNIHDLSGSVPSGSMKAEP